MTQSKEDEAAKERIIKHMNSDHQDSLVRYLEHHCHLSSFSARNAKLNNATLDSLSISTGQGKLHLVPIQPAMAAWSEARTRLAELDAQAVQGLGRSNITVKRYTRPTGFMAVVCLAVLLLYTVFFKPSNLQPGSIIYDVVLRHVAGFARFCYIIRPFVLYPMLAIHIAESIQMHRKNDRKRQKSRPASNARQTDVRFLYISRIINNGIAWAASFFTLGLDACFAISLLGRNALKALTRSTHASDQPSKFPFTKPIRKIVEPPIVAEMRKLHLATFKQSTAAGAGAEHLHLLYPPGLDINSQNNLRSSVTGNPFRDIFYNPPIGSENESSPAAPKVQHPSNTPQNSEPHPDPIIHRISTFTLPFMKFSFPQQAQKRISPTIQQQQPSFSTSTARPDADATTSSPEPLDIDRYHRLADTYIDALVAKLEEIQEERDEVDCEYSAGVLTLTFPPAGTYVLNKQPPNKQIWLSSPISGPKRYDYVVVGTPGSAVSKDNGSDGGGGGGEEDGASREGAGVFVVGVDGGEGKRGGGDWVYLRDGSTLSGLLREELGVDLKPVDVG
ncbi:MAG: hypothetical protein Q9185_001860 [Variospora sp. 1 TL-2023]